MPDWLKFLLVAISSWVILVIIFCFQPLLELWVENDSGNFYERIKNLYWFKVPFIFVLGFCGLTFAILWNIYNLYQSQKRKFEEEVKDVGQTLLRKYTELRSYDLRKTITKKMELFCNKYSFISAVQLYQYLEVPKNNDVIIRVTYVDGYVKEQTNLNGMIQQYYNINKKVLKEYQKALNEFYADKSKVEKLLDFIGKYKKQLEAKRKDELDRHDGIIYGFVCDCFDLLSEHYDQTPSLKFDPAYIKHRLDEINRKEQRIGILRGIELGNSFMFQYEKGLDNDKEGRMYLTDTVSIDDSKHIILITIDPELINEEITRKNLVIIIEEFKTILYEAVEKVYNELEEGKL